VSSFTRMQRIAGFGWLAAAALWAATAHAADNDKSLAQQIFETMIQVPGYDAAIGRRMQKESSARGCSALQRRGNALQSGSLPGRVDPVTVRLSSAAPDPFVADTAAYPRGMAVRFGLPAAARPTSSCCRITVSSSVR